MRWIKVAFGTFSGFCVPHEARDTRAAREAALVVSIAARVLVEPVRRPGAGACG